MEGEYKQESNLLVRVSVMIRHWLGKYQTLAPITYCCIHHDTHPGYCRLLGLGERKYDSYLTDMRADMSYMWVRPQYLVYNREQYTRGA